MQMLELLGFTIHTMGEILVGYTAIMVHHRVWKEHKIDEVVFEEMRKERFMGIIGLLLIIIGFLIQITVAALV